MVWTLSLSELFEVVKVISNHVLSLLINSACFFVFFSRRFLYRIFFFCCSSRKVGEKRAFLLLLWCHFHHLFFVYLPFSCIFGAHIASICAISPWSKRKFSCIRVPKRVSWIIATFSFISSLAPISSVWLLCPVGGKSTFLCHFSSSSLASLPVALVSSF